MAGHAEPLIRATSAGGPKFDVSSVDDSRGEINVPDGIKYTFLYDHHLHQSWDAFIQESNPRWMFGMLISGSHNITRAGG